MTQRQHAILRTFPIIGHVRYWLEAIGPELRQYIVTDNNEERPFSRDQRRWIYASAKRENNYFGFGSDNEMELQPSYLIIKHDTFPLEARHPGDAEFDPQFQIPCAKVMGGARGRARAFRPASIVNVSGMSFGSLSGPAVEALNRGCQIAGCLQSTGEGGVSSHHLKGGDLVWQVGTGYFGCREPDGRFSMARLKDTIARAPQIRAIEVKLSQGAKPGVGGLLPRAKINAEIAEIRGVPMDRDCISPAAHSAFRNADEMLDFIESIASETGLPVGIKSAVGDSAFWEDLARLMAGGTRGVDFITIDGGEGGTGAGPLVFTDHVALPFKVGFSRVQKIFTEQGLHQRILFIGSGKLGFPEAAVIRVRTGLRRDQRRPRSDDGDRLHPGAEVSHESLPDGRRDASSMARAGNRSSEQGSAAGQLHHHAAEGRARPEPCVRCPTSSAHHRRSTGAAGRPIRRKDHRRALWIRPRVWHTVADGLRGSASPDECVSAQQNTVSGAA